MTPQRFRTMGFGNDLTDVSDVALASTLERASQLANTYCSAPATPQRHDFRGGTVVGEQHRWPLPSMQFTDQTSRRVYPLHVPLRSITSFAVKFTNTYQVTVDPQNLYVNSTENWAEVVSIAAIVSGVYPVGINFGLYTPIAEVTYTYGWQYPVVGEVLVASSSPFTYQAANQYWLASATPAVYIDNVLQGSGVSFNTTEGTVTFTAAPSVNNTVTLDYTHRLPSPIAVATGLLASKLLSEADLIGKGMGNLASLRVEEVELRRTFGTGSSGRQQVAVMDPMAATYLDEFLYITAR